jgi:hypothetical protein
LLVELVVQVPQPLLMSEEVVVVQVDLLVPVSLVLQVPQP